MTLKLVIINLLTLIRIIGTIILIPIYNSYGGVAVGILSLICYLTDSIDGFLARHYKASTFFGALFDGFSDKLFTLINFIVLFLITPYAIIPIIFEIAIVIAQVFKFTKNYNVKSNIIGKTKVWVLAICVVITFLVSDISSIGILSDAFKLKVIGFNNNSYLPFLMPAIIIEFLTLFSYILEMYNPKHIKILNKEKKKLVLPELKNMNMWEKFKAIWLNPEFYEEHKDDTNLKDLIKLF